MKAVVIVGPVPEKQWRRPGLSRLMATVDECLVLLRITDLGPDRLIPAVGDGCERSIEGGPQFREQPRQRINRR